MGWTAPALIGMLLFLVAAGQPPAGLSPVVECRVAGDERAREYRLERKGEDWILSMREGSGRWIRLALPNAEPRFGEDSMTLEYRNANGGRQIEMSVAPGASRLDVYVDYGLDVNIEPDLDPAVDEMNTEGPLTSLDCSVHRP